MPGWAACGGLWEGCRGVAASREEMPPVAEGVCSRRSAPHVVAEFSLVKLGKDVRQFSRKFCVSTCLCDFGLL